MLRILQGSILEPLLFNNIYLNDLFLVLKDVNICNFADDKTPFIYKISTGASVLNTS